MKYKVSTFSFNNYICGTKYNLKLSLFWAIYYYIIGYLICMNTRFFMIFQRNPILLPNVQILFLYDEYKSPAYVYRIFSLYTARVCNTLEMITSIIMYLKQIFKLCFLQRKKHYIKLLMLIKTVFCWIQIWLWVYFDFQFSVRETKCFTKRNIPKYISNAHWNRCINCINFIFHSWWNISTV